MSLDSGGQFPESSSLGENMTTHDAASLANRRTKCLEDSEVTRHRQELKVHEILLLRLDLDKTRAWEKYSGLRLRLSKFFECRKCSRAIELADRVLDRVAAKLGDEGKVADKEIRDVAQFCFGVARNIIQEDRREERRITGIEDLAGGDKELPDVDNQSAMIVDKIDQERRLACLELCLARLGPDERKLLVLFYSAEEKQQIFFRKELAKTFGISVENLRVRACRIRARVEICEKLCLESSAEARAGSVKGF